MGQELVRADRTEEMERVGDSVDSRVFAENLVESADWGEEDDGIDVVEELGPDVPLVSSSSNIAAKNVVSKYVHHTAFNQLTILSSSPHALSLGRM